MPDVKVSKVGLDDFLYAGGDIDELILSASPSDGIKTDAADTRIAQLAELTSIEYDQVRKSIADDLSIRAATLDRLVQNRRQAAAEDAKAAAQIAAAPPPWADPVDGADLLAEIADVIQKFVVVDERHAWLAALWVVFTYVIDIAEINPFLRVVAPQENCGKSTLVAILMRLARRGRTIVRISNAAFARLVNQDHPALFLDEGDAFLNENEVMRNILDGAYERDTATVVTSIPTPDGGWVTVELDLFTPVAISSIGRLRRMRTVESRSIHINLKRATRTELKGVRKAYRKVVKDATRPLASKCIRWAADNIGNLDEAATALPDDSEAREADKFRMLVTIADLAGGPWPERARKLLVEASYGNAFGGEDWALMLLWDLRDLFTKEAGERKFSDDGDRIPSIEICRALADMPERPWSAYGRSHKPITQAQFAGQIRRFEIYPKTIRWRDPGKAEVVGPGYMFDDCADAFERYREDDRQADVAASSALASAQADPLTPFQGATVLQPNAPNGLEEFSGVLQDPFRSTPENAVYQTRATSRSASPPIDPISSDGDPADGKLISDSPGITDTDQFFIKKYSDAIRAEFGL